MDEWISFSTWRREPWKSHVSKKAVRQAIAYDRGLNRLRIFSRGVENGRVFFLEIPADQWGEMFEETA